MTSLQLWKSMGGKGKPPTSPKNDNSTLTGLIEFQNSPEGERFTRRFKKMMEKIPSHLSRDC